MIYLFLDWDSLNRYNTPRQRAVKAMTLASTVQGMRNGSVV